MSKTTIECKNITKVYKDADNYLALKGISFKIEEGEFVAIMGPSGSGKSTLMHILGCLDKPTTGSYILDGQNTESLSENDLTIIRRNKIGFVFQSFNLLPRTTVIRNVMLPLIYNTSVPIRKREGLAIEALKNSNLDEKYYRHLSNQLSGGQIQRVAIARSLINNPALILADEPTGNLDSKTGEIIIRTFQKLNNEGRTIVLITHEPDIAEHATRIINILDGQIISDKTNASQRLILPD